MNKAKSMCMVWVMLVAGTGLGQGSPQTLARSECLISVPDAFTGTVGLVLNSAHVAGYAAHQALGPGEAPSIAYSSMAGSGLVQLAASLPTDPTQVSQFWNAVCVHLRKAMEQVRAGQVDRLVTQLRHAEEQKAQAQAMLQGPSAGNPRTQATQEQLNQEADLSAFTRDMPLAEAMDRLRVAVQPPLQLVVLWNDLEIAGTDRNTPIGMDRVNPIRLETALKLLLKSVSALADLDIDYVIEDGVITIATRQTLQSLHKGSSEDLEGQPPLEDLAVAKQDLIRQRQALEMDLIRLRARRQAIEQQTAGLKKRIDLAVAQDPVLRESQRLVDLASDTEQQIRQMHKAGTASAVQVSEVSERVAKAKIELARQRGASVQGAGGDQLAKLTGELSNLAVDLAEREATLPALDSQIRQVETRLSQAASAVPRRIEREMAMRSLKDAQERISACTKDLAALEQPTIKIIGAGD